jgi:hypothetical protein
VREGFTPHRTGAEHLLWESLVQAEVSLTCPKRLPPMQPNRRKGAGKMRYHLHPLTKEYLWQCPQCGESIRLQTRSAVHLAERAGACQGCRAKATFERRPELIGIFLSFWARSGASPHSASWMEAIPPSGISVLASAYQSRGVLRAKRAVTMSRLAS